MKKFNVKSVLFSFIVLLSFSSCKNFMNGLDLLSDLESTLNYANAPSMKVYILAEEGSGAFITGGGDRYCKVTDSFEVEFQVNDKYQFIKWQAVNKKDNSISMSEYVSFSSENTLATKVTINKLPEESEILIQPLCQKHLDYKNIVPLNLNEGVSKDSSITITFSNKLSSNNDVNKIEIISDGDSVKNCFETPVINEEYFIITAKKDNTIPVNKGEIKEVQIIIPSDFYYEGVGGSCIPLGSEISYTYKINSTTNDKVDILFDNANVGNISPSGNLSYNIGETQELSLTPAEGYIFKYWKVIVGGKTYSYNSSSSEKSLKVLTAQGSVALEIEDATSTSTTVTVKSELSGVVIKPECELSFILTEFKPELLQSGVWANTPIECTFNIPVDESTVNFTNIQITDKNGNSLTEYFNAPEVNTFTNTVSITPKTLELLLNEYLFTKNLLSINVSLSSKLRSKTGLPLVQDKMKKLSFVYNKNVEKNPPVFQSIKVAKNESDYKNNENLLSIKTLENYTSPDFKTNHINNKLYMSISFYDEESKVDKIYIRETHITNVLGEFDQLPSYPVTELSGNCLETDKNRITTVTVDYTLKSTKDGAILIEVYAIDTQGNESKPKAFTVIRDADVNTKGLSYYNGYKREYYTNPQNFFDRDEFAEALRNVYITYNDYYYGDLINNENVNVRFLYGYSYDNLIEGTVIYDSENEVYKCHMDIGETKTKDSDTYDSSVSDVVAKLIVKDSNGAQYEKNLTFPGRVCLHGLKYTDNYDGDVEMWLMALGSVTTFFDFEEVNGKYRYYSSRSEGSGFVLKGSNRHRFCGEYEGLLGILSYGSSDFSDGRDEDDGIGCAKREYWKDHHLTEDACRKSFGTFCTGIKSDTTLKTVIKEIKTGDLVNYNGVVSYPITVSVIQSLKKGIGYDYLVVDKPWEGFKYIALNIYYYDEKGNQVKVTYCIPKDIYEYTFYLPAVAHFRNAYVSCIYLCNTALLKYSLYDDIETPVFNVADPNTDKWAPIITPEKTVTGDTIQAFSIFDHTPITSWSLYIENNGKKIKVPNAYMQDNKIYLPLQSEFQERKAALYLEVEDSNGNIASAENKVVIPKYIEADFSCSSEKKPIAYVAINNSYQLRCSDKTVNIKSSELTGEGTYELIYPAQTEGWKRLSLLLDLQSYQEISNIGYVYISSGINNLEKSDLITTLDGVMFYSNYPCAIEVIASSSEPPSFQTDEEAYKWWRNRHFLMTETIIPASGFNIKQVYTIDTSSIPEGYYYTAVIHFADGSVKLRKVEKK